MTVLFCSNVRIVLNTIKFEQLYFFDSDNLGHDINTKSSARLHRANSNRTIQIVDVVCILFWIFLRSLIDSSDNDGKPVVRKPSQTEGGQIVGKGGVVVYAVIVGLGSGQIVVAKSGGVIDERSDGGNLGDQVDRGGSLFF